MCCRTPKPPPKLRTPLDRPDRDYTTIARTHKLVEPAPAPEPKPLRDCTLADILTLPNEAITLTAEEVWDEIHEKKHPPGDENGPDPRPLDRRG